MTNTPDAAVLDDTVTWFRRFIGTMCDDDLRLLALWALHTHVAKECYSTPRLLLDSPVPESGKTTTLEHLRRLCCRPVLMASLSSAALLGRITASGDRTLLIDEADRTLRKDNPMTPDIVALLNSGYKRGATRPVLEPGPGGVWRVNEIPTFAPVVMAGVCPELPDDTKSRTIRVVLLPSASIECSDWELIEADAKALYDRIAVWADASRDAIKTYHPELPPDVTNRFAEKWRPLARVAECFGGEWPAHVCRMASADVEQTRQEKEDGAVNERPHILALNHLFEIWPDNSAFVPTRQLINAMVAAHPEEWGPQSPFGKALTPQRLGRMLVRFHLTTRQWPDGGRQRGYRLDDVQRVAERMGIHPKNEPCEPFEAF